MKADEVRITISDEEWMTGVKFSASLDAVRLTYWLLARQEQLPGEEETPLYVEKDDQGWNTYDGVTCCVLGPTNVHLFFSAYAQERLATDPEVTIEFEIAETDFVLLTQAFQSMFRNHPEFHFHSEVSTI